MDSDYSRARLGFRRRPTTGRAGGRDEALGVGAGRDGVLYVPDTAERAAPIMVFLHGRAHLRPVLAAADRYGVILVAPDSRAGGTWDLIAAHGFGPDVEFLDRMLNAIVDRVDADLSLLAIGGVSDGASYALSVGLANGDVFSTVIAFSPGFFAVPEAVGKPRVFVSHGTADPILPIDGSSAAFVPQLRGAGYEVMFRPFDGGHTVPPEIADQGMRWWLAGPSAGEASEAPA
jgi:phospholipase/carboxylesterase